MKGYIVTVSGKTAKMALPDGSLAIILSNKYICSEHLFECSGIDKNGNIHSWCKELLDVGSCATIELANINDAEVSEAKIRTFPDEKEDNRLLLEYYTRLKAELANDGLI